MLPPVIFFFLRVPQWLILIFIIQALASAGIGASNLPSLINQVNKKTIEEVVHKYIFDQEFVEAWYGCSDAANDAAANVQRSWNFLPGGQGQEFASRNAY